MALFSRWFSKKESEDYEEILSSLALDVQKRQTRLSEMRLRERRATLLITAYALALWAAYVALWYAGWLPNDRSAASSARKFAQGAPIVVGPILIQFTRRIVQTWYSRKENAEEKTLKALLTKQRTTVEDIKKKTNYYSTRNLIERYDSSPAATPLRQRAPAQQQGTPQSNGRAQPSPAAVRLPNGLVTAPQTPPQPPRKQWYDKVADALLGDDELSAGGAASRFALICQKCLAHNGLVKESMWEDTQYVCPKCGHLNPSPRSLKEARGASPVLPHSPRSPQSRLPGPTPPAGENVVRQPVPLSQAPAPVSSSTREPDADVLRPTQEQDHVGERSVHMDIDSERL